MTETPQISSPSAERSDALHWYREIFRIRRFEDAVKELFTGGLVRGTTHLANGQEAVAVGTSAALARGDLVLCTYRGHHHALARGMSLEAAFGEILGRTSGCCEGRGGSMHLTDVSLGILGAYAIVGSHLPIAVGSAWSAKLQGKEQVTVCFFGDGTTTIGSFHEALNLAAVWSLPVIFVCENNLYSEYTRIEEVVPVDRPAADRASAYGLEPIVVDGNDVRAVRAAVADARRRALEGHGPSLIEATTYRQGGHSRADPAKYRPQAEVDHWLTRDPLTLLEQSLSAEETGRLHQLHADVQAEVAAALETAKAAPEPSPEDLLQHVWGEAPRWQF